MRFKEFMIYISTSCLKKPRNVINVLTEYEKAGFENIELGSVHEYFDISLLKNFNFNYIIHNYFPPPKEEFNLNFAILPVGDNFTMGIKDAMRAAQMIQCTSIIGVHFDTFPYVAIDHTQAYQVAESEQVNLTLPNIGDSISF